jgi:beta-xylosidase
MDRGSHATTERKRLDKEELLRIEREGIRSQKDMRRMLLPQSAKKRLAETDTSESDENDTSSGSDLDNENDEDSTKEASTTNLMLDGADESSSAYERSASSTISRGETPAASMKSRKRKHAPLSQVKTTEEKLLSAVDEILYDIAELGIAVRW